MKKIKTLSIILLFLCLILASCNTGFSSNKSWPIEPLNSEEFAYFADNANVFADDVLASETKFLYVQLACDDDIAEDDAAVANDNADGICAMITNDYHDVLDARPSSGDIAEMIAKKMNLADDAKILVIGDDAAELQVYEKLITVFKDVDYWNSYVASDEDYDEMYTRAMKAEFNAVIVANDAAAFHEQSFPFQAN